MSQIYGTTLGHGPQAMNMDASKPQGGIMSQMERLEHIVAFQNDVLCQLESRLSFITKPMVAQTADVPKAHMAPSGSAAADHLRILMTTLDQHNQRILGLIESIDL
jgi:hypothetical protein